MKLNYHQTVAAMSRALELLDALPNLAEAEALRIAWLEQHENNRPEPQLSLLKETSRESMGNV